MEAIVQPGLRKWISEKVHVKKSFDELVDEVMKLEKTVLLAEIESKIANKTNTLRELYESAIAEEGDLNGFLAIEYHDEEPRKNCELELQNHTQDSSNSQSSQEPQPGTSRAAAESDLMNIRDKPANSTSATSSEVLSSQEVARVICEFAGGDTVFDVKTKKPPGTRKRGRKKKGAVESGDEQQDQLDEWADLDAKLYINEEDFDNSFTVSDEEEMDLFETDWWFDRELREDLDESLNPNFMIDDYVFDSEEDEDRVLLQEVSSDEEGSRFNPVLKMPPCENPDSRPPSVVNEVEVESAEMHSQASSSQDVDENAVKSKDPVVEDSGIDGIVAPIALRRSKRKLAQRRCAQPMIVKPMKMKSLMPAKESEDVQEEGPSNNNTATEAPGASAPTNNAEETRPQSPTRFEEFMKRAYGAKTDEIYAQLPEDVKALREAFVNPIPDEILNGMADIINPLRSTTEGGAFREKPIVRGASMPPLVPPFTKEAMANVQCLDVFMTHSEDPSGFQWRSNNVQQQINYDMLNIAYKKRIAQRKKDYATMDHSLLVSRLRDILIEISVYKQNDPDDSLPDDVKLYSEPKLAYKVELLGSHTIEDFMDKLMCPLDLISTQEVAHPDKYVEAEEHMLKNKRLAKMVVIENKIYPKNDGDFDFVGSINAWANSKIRKPVGPFEKGCTKTKFEDLTIRFGYPYLYVHLNNCEHIVVINKARMMEPNDEHRLECYPRVLKSTYMRNVYCRIDNDHLARWAVVNYAEFPENPMFICTNCVKNFCYTNKGAKRGSFLLYPFRQIANVL